MYGMGDCIRREPLWSNFRLNPACEILPWTPLRRQGRPLQPSVLPVWGVEKCETLSVFHCCISDIEVHLPCEIFAI